MVLLREYSLNGESPGAAELVRIAKAFECLPPQARRALQYLPQSDLQRLEEVRLRVGKPCSVTFDGLERRLCEEPVTREQLELTVRAAANGFIYSAEETIKDGFITITGGHRVGLCGRAVCENGRIKAIKDYSSLCVRIARAVRGVAAELAEGLIKADGQAASTLIISPPGVGKTTLLRDTARQFSLKGMRVGVADERGELAAAARGEPQFDLGPCCDIIDGCSKADGAMLLLRSMAPSVLVMDEVTAQRDVEAVCAAAHCGVAVLATAHAADLEELCAREVYAPLIKSGVFERVAAVRRDGPERRAALYDMIKKEGGI